MASNALSIMIAIFTRFKTDSKPISDFIIAIYSCFIRKYCEKDVEQAPKLLNLNTYYIYCTCSYANYIIYIIWSTNSLTLFRKYKVFNYGTNSVYYVCILC